MKKSDLPTKTCLVCERPFSWRKKWEKVWADVKYCSQRCRRSKGGVISVLIVIFCLFAFPSNAQSQQEPKMSVPNAYQFEFQSIDGEAMPLSDFKGQVVLIVNTASECGLTGQYKELQSLYDTYSPKGFSVIGVPCNNFGNQEPGSAETIKDFVKNKYGVTFPLTRKYDVKGADAHPFFEWAADQKMGGFLQNAPKWNFHKYLIDREGNLAKSFGSQVNPSSEKIRSEIERLLKDS